MKRLEMHGLVLPILSDAMKTLADVDNRDQKECGLAFASIIANDGFSLLRDYLTGPEDPVVPNYHGPAGPSAEMRKAFEFDSLEETDDFYQNALEGYTGPGIMRALVMRRIGALHNKTMAIIEAVALDTGYYHLAGLAKIGVGDHATVYPINQLDQPGLSQSYEACKLASHDKPQTFCGKIKRKSLVWKVCFEQHLPLNRQPDGRLRPTTFAMTMAAHFPEMLDDITKQYWHLTPLAVRTALKAIEADLRVHYKDFSCPS